MNLDSFYTYLEHPNTLNSQSLNELSELITRYPYFQSARLLFLKNLHLLNDYRYNDELRVVSAYAGNRKVLYELINENKNNLKETSVTINSSIPENNSYNISETSNINEEVTISKIEDAKVENIEHYSDQLSTNIEIKEEEQLTQEENNSLPEVTEEIKILDISEKVIEIAEEKEIIPQPINISPKEIEVPITPEKDVDKEILQNKTELEQSVKDDTITEDSLTEIPVSIVENIIITNKKEATEKIIKTEPVKESVADMILKKVAAINAERAKSKEQVKSEVETKPIILQEQSFVNHEQLLDEIIAENKSKTNEIKTEIPIVVTEENKHVEIVVDIKPEIEDVTADSFIVITEEEDLTKYDVIQEIEYAKEEVKEIEPVSFTKNFKRTLIISDEKQIIENISEITNNEIDVSNQDSMLTSETEKEVIIVKDYSFDEQTPLFTAPAYDINSLLEKEPVLKDSAEIEKTENLEQISMPFEKWLDFISKDTKKVAKSKTNPDLIEAFIKSEPRLSFKIAPDNSNSRQKEPLISHNEIELVSESLADIYAKQGLTDKAISMYEKLALQYPEKNIYFANLILKIKEQNSNQ